MRIGVFGCGYVGLVSGVCFAHMNHQVICADVSAEKIATLKTGGLPIWEQGLQELLEDVIDRGKISFTTDMAHTIQNSDILLIAVGTPSLPDGTANLSYVWSVVEAIAEYTDHHKLIVVKSTVPVGTSDAIKTYLDEYGLKDKIIDVVHNPEFLRQGNAVHDFLHPDRIVIGYEQDESRRIMNELYEEFPSPIQFCNRKSAELIKYAANGFLAMKISYINMLARLSDQLGADIEQVARGIGGDRRIGPSFLKAGIGYGGSCFPKDTKALISLARSVESELPLIEATVDINETQPRYLFHKLEEQMQHFEGKQIALLGLTYKALTDDIREAPSLEISKRLMEKGAHVKAYDPLIRDYPIPEVSLQPDVISCVTDSDAAIILTDWEEFKRLDIPDLVARMNNPLIVDGRNLFSPDQMRKWAEEIDLAYVSVGRPIIQSGLNSLTCSP
ncbi:MAG: UDP-glucose/GDP-mannose dehydrogenase family protein [Bacillaceae bacterium]|nr:UDP-glucose/GDP-mannose dehydrogenase family protein [Bacillaceae bacterium]